MRSAEQDAAYVEFVAARQLHFRRVAYALCGDWHRADDMVQVALTKLYLAWPRIRREGSEEAYVRRVIVTSNIDEHRRWWRRHEVIGLPEKDEPAPVGMSVEDRSALIDNLQRLPVMQRKAVVLRHWLGMSVEETAHELGISEGTVKSHTSRGLSRLQGLLTAGTAI
ncbi:MAG: SigE family RNA polymerase sigma factor [Nocardioides sp.]